jgi:hypothetical protein
MSQKENFIYLEKLTLHSRSPMMVMIPDTVSIHDIECRKISLKGIKRSKFTYKGIFKQMYKEQMGAQRNITPRERR